jgi:hypothetical protein
MKWLLPRSPFADAQDDEFSPRMAKSIALYNAIKQRKPTVILTHYDLFQRQITKIPFKTGSRFTDYSGLLPESLAPFNVICQDMIEYIQSLFVGCTSFHVVYTPMMDKAESLLR